jgi:hypothetical protein
VWSGGDKRACKTLLFTLSSQVSLTGGHAFQAFPRLFQVAWTALLNGGLVTRCGGDPFAGELASPCSPAPSVGGQTLNLASAGRFRALGVLLGRPRGFAVATRHAVSPHRSPLSMPARSWWGSVEAPGAPLGGQEGHLLAGVPLLSAPRRWVGGRARDVSYLASGMQPLRVWRGSFRALALDWGGSGGWLPPRTPAAQLRERQKSLRAASRCRIRANPRVISPTKGAGEPHRIRRR